MAGEEIRWGGSRRTRCEELVEGAREGEGLRACKGRRNGFITCLQRYKWTSGTKGTRGTKIVVGTPDEAFVKTIIKSFHYTGTKYCTRNSVQNPML